MAQGVHAGNFRWFLRNKAGDYYYIDVNGDVQTTVTKTEIKHAPDGWLETDIEWTRAIDFGGIFRSFTTPYKFVLDAAKVLRYISVTGSFEAYCAIDIELQNDQTTIWEDYYSGVVDFISLSDDGTRLNVSISEGGLKAILDANRDVQFEIPIDTGSIVVNEDGIKLQAAYNYIPIQSSQVFFNGITVPNVLMSNAFFNEEGDYNAGATSDQPIPPELIAIAGSVINNASFDRYMFEALIDQSIKFVIKQEFFIENTGSGNLDFQIQVFIAIPGGTHTIIHTETVYTHPTVTAGNTAQFIVDTETGQFTILKGQRLFLILRTVNTSSTTSATNAALSWFGNPDDGILTNTHAVASIFRLDTTPCKGYRYYKYIELFVDKMTAGQYVGESTYLSDPGSYELDNYPYQTIVTCGDALRQFTDTKIVSKLNDIHKDVMGNWQCGIGIEDNKIKVEPLSYFFDGAFEITDLGNVSEFSWQFAAEYIFNKYKSGYLDQDYDGLNGRDEFNTTHEYLMPVKSSTNESDYASDYRADNYGVEYTRANLIGKKTTDSKSDNDTFIEEIEDAPQVDGSFNLLRPTGTITGILFPETKFNFGITPKRRLFRNAGWLQFILNLLGAETITFQTSQKNQELISQFGSSPTITEKADVLVSDLAAFAYPTAKPVIFRFKAQPPGNMMALMATNPRGYFSFNWNGNTYQGFPMTAGTKPATYDIFNFVLLATPSCDLTPLIV